MSQAPIFVVGTPRSGTTLTARILGSHPGIFMPGETHFMEDIYARRQELGELEDPEARRRIVERLRTLYGRFNEPADQERVERLIAEDDLEGALDAARSYREVFEIFMGRQMAAQGRRRWGNQVPRDLFELHRLFNFFPDARVLVCIRDLRDFMVSYRDKWKTRTGWEADRLKKLYHPVLTSLLWRSSVNALEEVRQRYSERIFVSRYETLVGNPEAQVKAICDFIGEDFEPSMLEITSDNSSADQKGAGIFKSSVGRWRGQLSPADVVLAQRICGRQLNALGYSLEPIAASPVAVVSYLLSTPYSAYRALAANAPKRGPLLPYLVKRIGNLVRS